MTYFMKKSILIILSFFATHLIAQEQDAIISDSLTFKKLVQWYANPVESQGKTGTCWSFSTASFLESEII